MLKVVICDDCEKARYILKCYFQKLHISQIEIIGEAQDGVELIEVCKKTTPDIIVSDIDMPNINGINAAKKIVEFLPDASFIFITGHLSYAVDSFEVYPVDYILKPISIERLEKSIKHIHKKSFKEVEEIPSDIIIFSANREIITISQQNILFIERSGRKTIIHTITKVIEVYESLDSIEHKLNSQIFTRIHRSYIINKNVDFTISKTLGRTREIIFEGSEQTAYISRKNIKSFEDQLKTKTK